MHEIFWGQIHTHAEVNRRVGCGLLTLPRTSAILADRLMLLVIPNQPFLSKNNSLWYKDLASRAVFNIEKKHSKKIFKFGIEIFAVTRQLCWCQGKTSMATENLHLSIRTQESKWYRANKRLDNVKHESVNEDSTSGFFL